MLSAYLSLFQFEKNEKNRREQRVRGIVLANSGTNYFYIHILSHVAIRFDVIQEKFNIYMDKVENNTVKFGKN